MDDYATKIMRNFSPLYNSTTSGDTLPVCIKGKYGAWATDLKYFEKLCMVAIKLAPEVFGTEHKNKLINAYLYAIKKKYLTDGQAKCIYDLLHLEEHKEIPIVDEHKPKRHIVCPRPRTWWGGPGDTVPTRVTEPRT